MSDAFPTHLQIQTTSACGAACSICPHPVESPGWSNGLMTPELFERIVDQLRGRPVEYLCPYLMADPMSDRHIFDRIAMLRDALPDTHFEVSTTGLYLVPKIAERLLAAPLSELRLSSHGTTADEWARTMPGVRHERGWPNLMAFIERWKQTRPYPLRIVTLWGLWSTQREDEIDGFWDDLGVETVKWRVISRAEQVDLTVFGNDAGDDSRGEPPYRCRFDRDTQWMNILSDGRVTLCCMDYKHEAVLGSVVNETLEEVWNGAAYAHARAQVRGDVPSAPDFICNRCEWHVSAEEPAVPVGAAHEA